MVWYFLVMNASSSDFLTCMPQALIYHNRAKDLLKSCFRISRDTYFAEKKTFLVWQSYTTWGCLLKMTTTTDKTKQKLQPYEAAFSCTYTVTESADFGFNPLLWCPQSPQGCLKKQNHSLSSNLVVWCTTGCSNSIWHTLKSKMAN